MAKAKWGAKRVCQNCGAKYYDFNKTPVKCPSCDAEFDPEAFMRGRRSRAATILPAADITPETAAAPELADAAEVVAGKSVASVDVLDADAPAPETDSEVPEDLDLGPEFDNSNDSAADDDSLLDDDELGEDGLPSVDAIAGSDGDDDDS